MDCTDLSFDSAMADWHAVSFATRYVSVLADPGSVKDLNGDPLGAALRGYVVQKLPGKLPREDRKSLSASDHDNLSVLTDPVTGQPARDPEGRLLVMETPDKAAPTEGVQRMVGWRSGTGITIAYGGTADDILDALSGAFPEVNVLRLDFNAATAASHLAGPWADFARNAATRGYRLIIQNSDGELAGGFLADPSGGDILPADRLGPEDALSHADGMWKINGVQRDWRDMLAWFQRPENASILAAVAGWELINEPMAYGKGAKAGRLYSRHMADLIASLDWMDKRILVSGLGASAQFADLDHDLIRKAAGDALVWSVHMYPAWVAPPHPDSRHKAFGRQICARIGSLRQPGDDILITETQLYTEAGSLWPDLASKRAATSFNMARSLPWLSQQGIGWTWWPPTSRGSDLLQWQGRRKGYRVELESAAFSHLAWTYGRHSASPPEGEAWGSSGDDALVVSPSGGKQDDRITNAVANPHGLVFGLEGRDQIGGHDRVDMLYGGADPDTLSGHDGDDWLFGGQDADYLDGGEGNDVLVDWDGENVMSGGPRDDHLEGSGTLDGGRGDDRLIAAPDSTTTLTGGPGSDRFLPDAGSRVTITDFVPGEDRLDWTMLGPDFRCDLSVQVKDAATLVQWQDLQVRMEGIDHDPGADCKTPR
ncbi:calcium-binding protein [Paracoccus benzoatiresistens]|uniref:Calcium-binding protein n=1 Tax=Paracoccus benzoatiresistens TaxID=2997341 RepID=A0ABT4J1P8_9RHOB|nr:calcium-binding protein [Paracoccus sp. EF6]MCZ0961034.1 calcium-binding protein [Paracoccus sp. EF6]